MTLLDFLNTLLSTQLTMNEITVLLELGYADFTREDLLNNPNRCHVNTYSAAALTRTIQKLSLKNPAIISTYVNTNGKTTYRLIDGPKPYGQYEQIILSVARSRVLTVNTIKTTLKLIENNNKISTTRYLANKLNLDPDYLAATVLPRMIVVGLLKTTLIDSANPEINYSSNDKFPIHGVYLDLLWEGVSKITLL